MALRSTIFFHELKWVGFASRIVFVTEWKNIKWYAVPRNEFQELNLMKFWLWHLLSLDFSKIAVMKCFDLLMWSAIVVCRSMLKFSNKNTFFLHEMDKLTVVLMSIKWLNKIERPLVKPYCTPNLRSIQTIAKSK